MKESEYSNAANLARVRAMKSILHDITPFIGEVTDGDVYSIGEPLNNLEEKLAEACGGLEEDIDDAQEAEPPTEPDE